MPGAWSAVWNPKVLLDEPLLVTTTGTDVPMGVALGSWKLIAVGLTD
jgi:hypothetical protein